MSTSRSNVRANHFGGGASVKSVSIVQVLGVVLLRNTVESEQDLCSEAEVEAESDLQSMHVVPGGLDQIVALIRVRLCDVLRRVAEPVGGARVKGLEAVLV